MTQLRVVYSKEQSGLSLARKPVQRVQAARVLREGSTGRVVSSGPRLALVPRPVKLERVWAVAEAESVAPEDGAASELAPEMAFYRKYTEAMVRRYLRLAMQAGRVPSLLGRELFRGNVSHYRMHNFEDVVIFCFDMERCLNRLGHVDGELIKRIAMQHYSHFEAASMLGLNLLNPVRRYGLALDRLTQLLLEVKLLEPLKPVNSGNPVDFS